MKNGELIRTVKRAAKDKFAWPGGYPLFVLMNDGECLCVKCVKENFGQIGRATRDNLRDGWAAGAVDINWEDGELYCAHCNERIESAYAEPEENTGAES